MKPHLRARLRSRRAIVSMAVLLVLFVLVVSGGGHLGLFAHVDVSRTELGPYVLAGIPYTGSYRKMFKHLDRDFTALGEAVPGGTPAALIEGPLGRLPRHLTGALVGTLVATVPAARLPAPLTAREVPRRSVVVARIRAHRTVAALKTYRRLRAYLADNGLQAAGEVLEIYHDDGTVELQVPVLTTTPPPNDGDP